MPNVYSLNVKYVMLIYVKINAKNKVDVKECEQLTKSLLIYI